MLASFRQDPTLLSSSSAASMDCFSQFLMHPVLPKVPDSSPVSENSQSKPVLSTVSESPTASTQPEKKLETNVGLETGETLDKDENEEDIEERQSVQNITKALNIECDVYRANKKRRGMKSDAHNKLPKEVQGLMGEANLCFARGKYDDALKMCMEIIRIAPWCPDPFETLAMIYEERGENIKGLQYSLLAAYLQTGDVDLWLRLAENCEDAGLLMQAAHCYNKALKLKPDDYKLYWAAAVSQQQLGNVHQALVLFKSVVRLIPETEVAQRMALARDIARACHANEETALALEVMDEVASKHPDHVKYEDVNVMCELAITSKQYRKVFDVMVKHCQIEVQYESEMDTDEITEEVENNIDFTLAHVKIPEHLPIDLKCKCVLAAIPMKCFNVVEDIFHEICGMDASEYGDLQFDIAELLMDECLYVEAIFVLDILVTSSDYSLAAVWLKKGECHRELGQDIAEMNCFKQVVKKAPGHTKAYLALCKVLRKLGKCREAIDVVRDAETYELDNDEQMLLNFEKFHIYHEWSAVSKKRGHEILCKAADTALLMIANKLEAAFAPSKTMLIKKPRQSHKKFKGDVRVTRRVGKNFYKHKDKRTLAARGNAAVISIEDWWEFFLLTCEILLKTERYLDAITIVDGALSYGYWYCNTEKRLKLERLACSFCMISGNYSLAYSFMRPWLLNRASSNVLWNLFNQITVRSEDQRHHRFCLRFLVKEPDSIALAVLNGHNSLATGTYKHSLGEYIRAHRRIPSEPMFMLLIGIIYTHISAQRFTTHKNSLVVQALAFLNKYAQHRKCSQEIYYNLARTFHELGLRHFAVHWYRKALETPPPTGTGLDNSIIDLKCEIGYNLAILYRKSGNQALAMQILSKYCII
uniref:general transcription factor 3C polypeptide 3-like n=1 Tax=Styela clava TaxID=7725 RepID=UPI00193A77C2|nr:general transcription factor 3C polypeptide 3-like [Styela clava]